MGGNICAQHARGRCVWVKTFSIRPNREKGYGIDEAWRTAQDQFEFRFRTIKTKNSSSLFNCVERRSFFVNGKKSNRQFLIEMNSNSE